MVIKLNHEYTPMFPDGKFKKKVQTKIVKLYA